MIQFIDIEIIKALILFFFASGLIRLSLRHNKQKKEKRWTSKKKSYEKYYWLVYIAFLALIPLFEADSARINAEANIKSFRGAKVLRCITKENQYRVSQRDGWQVEKYFFIKESLMIRADKCEEM